MVVWDYLICVSPIWHVPLQHDLANNDRFFNYWKTRPNIDKQSTVSVPWPPWLYLLLWFVFINKCCFSAISYMYITYSSYFPIHSPLSPPHLCQPLSFLTDISFIFTSLCLVQCSVAFIKGCLGYPEFELAIRTWWAHHRCTAGYYAFPAPRTC